MPPNSWMFHFSPSSVSMIRRFSWNKISEWVLFLAIRNSRTSARDNSGFLPRIKKVFIIEKGLFWLIRVMLLLGA